jgi:16S rRNA (cytosine967-C5)-methyltransferase
VLRRVSRERNRLPLPPRPGPDADGEAALEYLAITLSHPRWLVARWLDRYGFDRTESWAVFNNTPPALTLRANRLRVSAQGLAQALAGVDVGTQPARLAPDGLVVTRGNPLLSPLADQGLFVVQEEASQLVPFMSGATGEERVLDACASPGGKTIAMAAMMKNRGLIAACDVRRRRVELLAKTVAASGASCVRVVQADAASPLPFGAVFDCVLLDAPCSGLGTVRRDPDVKWRRREQDFVELSRLQIAMLRQTAAVLKRGGRLIYSTCSSEPEENEDVVRAFASESGMVPAKPPDMPPGMASLINDAGHLRTYPFRDGVEAFFAAILKRT